MCFHIHSILNKKSKSFVEDLFSAEMQDDSPVSYHHVNGFQHPLLMIITQEAPHVIQRATWSIAPPSYFDIENYWKTKGGSTLNTRDDSLFTEKAAGWKSEAALHRKCIVLVSGYFEPHKVANVSYPYLLHRSDFELFGLVGIYTKQRDHSLTFSVLTTKADDFLARVHNAAKRMPMSVLPEDKDSVLSITTEEHLKKEFQIGYSVPLQAKAVHRDILNSRIDTNNDKYVTDIFHPIFTDF
ncbi:MAG: hypothetical protein CMB99_15035 [Flavobacteriaceae bacterium]|nr:hypothetical protein [Flavobacteriaceae bacterium]|tara:strand:- start:315948 stop:316670 length:723 start_codon:yes stop_codon:yes gene_type:complete